MPRKTVKQKRVGKNIPVQPEMASQYERNRALKALAVAKEQEAERMANGYRYIRDGKTRRLVKVAP